MQKEVCWQAILRVMGDGKPRRYAQIADVTGYQVNTVERYCNDINKGVHGNYRIETRREDDKSTVLARLVVNHDTIPAVSVAAGKAEGGSRLVAGAVASAVLYRQVDKPCEVCGSYYQINGKCNFCDKEKRKDAV